MFIQHRTPNVNYSSLELAMSRKQDLRVIKTERAIYLALVELLKRKDLEKITVSELSEKAEINKATFYLHYSDIYSLYQEALARHIKEIICKLGLPEKFFNDPEEFSRCLINDFFTTEVMANDPFFKNTNQIYNRTLSYHICNAFTEEVLSSELLPNTRENTLKMEFFFTGIAFLRQEHAKEDDALIIQILASSIKDLFGLTNADTE